MWGPADWTSGFSVAISARDHRDAEALARAAWPGWPAALRLIFVVGWRVRLGPSGRLTTYSGAETPRRDDNPAAAPQLPEKPAWPPSLASTVGWWPLVDSRGLPLGRGPTGARAGARRRPWRMGRATSRQILEGGSCLTSCAECGFQYESIGTNAIAEALRARAITFMAALPADLRARPAPDVWSPIEYACHVRDVLQVQIGRVARGLVEDTPSFEPMGRDLRPEQLRYADQDAEVVRFQVLEAASALADVFAGMNGDHLARTITYNWPERMVRPLRWVGRHTVHELVHHTMDVERQRGGSVS